MRRPRRVRTVSVATAAGPVQTPVAYDLGYLAVTRATKGWGFALTHVPTGYAVIDGGFEADVLRGLGEELLSMLDWSQTDPQYYNLDRCVRTHSVVEKWLGVEYVQMRTAGMRTPC